jgi:hypothetical protein
MQMNKIRMFHRLVATLGAATETIKTFAKQCPNLRAYPKTATDLIR